MIKWKVYLSIVVCVTFLCLVVWLTCEWVTTSNMMVAVTLETEARRLAVRLFFAEMRTTGQTMVALIGGLWALLLVPESRMNVVAFPALIVFIVANASLAISLMLYTFGYNFLLSRMFYHAALDLGAPKVDFYQTFQQWFFLFGVVAVVATIVLGFKKS